MVVIHIVILFIESKLSYRKSIVFTSLTFPRLSTVLVNMDALDSSSTEMQALGMRGRCLAVDARWQIRPRFVDLANRARRMAANRAIPAIPSLCRPLLDHTGRAILQSCSRILEQTGGPRVSKTVKKPIAPAVTHHGLVFVTSYPGSSPCDDVKCVW